MVFVQSPPLAYFKSWLLNPDIDAVRLDRGKFSVNCVTDFKSQRFVDQLPLMSFPASGDLDLAKLPYWLHWVESCPSTNTWAIDRAHHLDHGAVVFTRCQTAGRGQHKRTWHSPSGVLTASFVLDFPIAQLSGLSLIMGLAVIYALENLLPDQQGKFRLKWPNDVLIQGRKVAGILCEATSRGDSRQTRVVVGIGLNRCVNFTQAGLTPEQIGNAISLDQVSAVILEELVLLERLRHYLIQVAEILVRAYPAMTGLISFLPQLRDRDLLLNCSIRLLVADQTFAGSGVGFDSLGRLLLKLPGGEIRAFTTGRVVDWEQE